MSDDIVARLREAQAECDLSPCDCQCYLHQDAIDEIERLRAALKDADDDFHALKAMFDNMRNERDQLRARLGLEESGQISTVDRIADLHDQIVRLVSGYND